MGFCCASVNSLRPPADLGDFCIVYFTNHMNKNKTITSILVAVLFLVGFIWLARPKLPNEGGLARPSAQNTSSTQVNNNANVLGAQGAVTVAESNNYDFGTISMAAGKVSREFTIKNTSSEAVTLQKIYTSCMCTTATLTNNRKQFGPFGMPGHASIPRIDQAINPNEEATVDVVFDPAAHGPAGVGKIERVVTIENSAGQPVELKFSALVTP